jgi:hypothetical protein
MRIDVLIVIEIELIFHEGLIQGVAAPSGLPSWAPSSDPTTGPSESPTRTPTEAPSTIPRAVRVSDEGTDGGAVYHSERLFDDASLEVPSSSQPSVDMESGFSSHGSSRNSHFISVSSSSLSRCLLPGPNWDPRR